MLLEDPNKVGVSNLMARMMTQGTRRKTPLELQEAIQQLGATINVNAGTEEITVNVNTLARNYKATLALVQEILLEPRWDVKEFDLLKQSTISQIRQQEANPNAVAQNNYNGLIYGKDNIRANWLSGSNLVIFVPIQHQLLTSNHSFYLAAKWVSCVIKFGR